MNFAYIEFDLLTLNPQLNAIMFLFPKNEPYLYGLKVNMCTKLGLYKY